MTPVLSAQNLDKRFGAVVAAQAITLDVQAGDRILFGKYSGSEVNLHNDDYVIMREEDVLAILGKDA